jgi:hypothetical protein
MILSDLQRTSTAVVSGSVMGWGTALEDGFSLIVFLTLATDIRIARLRVRELEQLGRVDEKFIEWAGQYDKGGSPGRNRARHEQWLSERSCPVLRLDGDLSVAQRIAHVLPALSRS